MKLTIDSHEPLSDVLRVVGSVYGVTLTTAENPSEQPAADRSAKGPSSLRAGGSRRRSRATEPSADKVDPKVVRQWARESGHHVNARGSLPSAVRDAYLAAHQS